MKSRCWILCYISVIYKVDQWTVLYQQWRQFRQEKKTFKCQYLKAMYKVYKELKNWLHIYEVQFFKINATTEKSAIKVYLNTVLLWVETNGWDEK